MIGAFEHHDFTAPGDGIGSDQGHDIGFGSGIAEAHALDRRDTGTHQRGEARFMAAYRTERNAVCQNLAHCGVHDGVGVPINPGGKIASVIAITMSVEVPHIGAFAACHG